MSASTRRLRALAAQTVAAEVPAIAESPLGRAMSEGTLDPRTIDPSQVRELMRPRPGEPTEVETQMATVRATSWLAFRNSRRCFGETSGRP